MIKPLSKENVILHKKQAIKKLNNLLETYINNPDEKYLKKANLLSYWLENFSDYVKEEDNFNPQKLISYKRGDVIKVNFGFNVGSEHGGLHYAIVLDNNNLYSSPVITVIPLSSGTADDTYERDVFLGQELYIKLNAKTKTLLENAQTRYKEISRISLALNTALNSSPNAPQTVDKFKSVEILKILSEMEKQISETENDINILNKYAKEISHMKRGSIALMEQITTISKMRIYVPKNSTDTLFGISFSAEAMEKINTQLIKLYLKNK